MPCKSKSASSQPFNLGPKPKTTTAPQGAKLQMNKFHKCHFYENFREFLRFGLHINGQLGFFTEITEILKVQELFQTVCEYINFFRFYTPCDINFTYAKKLFGKKLFGKNEHLKIQLKKK